MVVIDFPGILVELLPSYFNVASCIVVSPSRVRECCTARDPLIPPSRR